jgi:hypothetical protein
VPRADLRPLDMPEGNARRIATETLRGDRGGLSLIGLSSRRSRRELHPPTTPFTALSASSASATILATIAAAGSTVATRPTDCPA